MKEVQCIACDRHSGLQAARKAILPTIPRQRSRFHLMHRPMNDIPELHCEERYLRISARSSPAKTSMQRRKYCVAWWPSTRPQHHDLPTGQERMGQNARRSSRCRRCIARGCVRTPIRATEEGDEAENSGRDAVAQQSVSAASENSRADRILRRLGRRKEIPHHHPVKPIQRLKKANCFSKTASIEQMRSGLNAVSQKHDFEER